MAKRKLTHEEALEILDEQRRRALSDEDYAAYAALCDECGIIDNEEAYERGLMDRRQVIPVEELQEEGLEQVVKQEGLVVDESKFGQIVRSYVSGNNLRSQGNIKTNNPLIYADWIAGAFLDFTQRHNGYGVRVESNSGVTSGRMNHIYFSADFLEKMVGKGTYRTEYSTGFDEAHDDTDRTKPEDYQREHLNLLRDLVAERLPDASAVVKDRSLYVFKKE